MFRALRQAWDRYLGSLPKTEVVDSIPESQWQQAEHRPRLSPARRRSFGELMALIGAHRPPAEVAALVERAQAALLDTGEPAEALLAVLQPADAGADPADASGAIVCDWKAADEVPWQAERLCRAHGLAAGWRAPAGGLTEVLASLDAWLQPQGLCLLTLAAGDSAIAWAVRAESRAAAMALGRRLRLPIGGPGET